MVESERLEPIEYAHLVVNATSEKQASDVVMLDIKSVSDFADYFVIMTAESNRQMRSLIDDIEKVMKEAGGNIHHREGSPQASWWLLDFGDVVVHVFGPEARDFYDVEGAWPQADEKIRIQ